MDSTSAIKAATVTNESLWHFLAQLPTSFDAQILYGLLISGFVGIMAHYMAKWLRGEVEGSLWQYLFVNEARHTFLSLGTLFAASIAAIAANVFETDAGAFVGWTNVMWIGLTTGFSGDSVMNKAPRKVWTDAERAAVATVPEGGKP